MRSETAQDYMYHIRANADLSARNLLRDVAKQMGKNVFDVVDNLDGSTPVSL